MTPEQAELYSSVAQMLADVLTVDVDSLKGVREEADRTLAFQPIFDPTAFMHTHHRTHALRDALDAYITAAQKIQSLGDPLRDALLSMLMTSAQVPR